MGSRCWRLRLSHAEVMRPSRAERSPAASQGPLPGPTRERVNDWADAISAIDGTTAEAVMAGLAEATGAARGVDSAPEEVRDEHEQDRLRGRGSARWSRGARPPRASMSWTQPTAELSTELAITYPDLEDDSRLVERFAEEECGREFG